MVSLLVILGLIAAIVFWAIGIYNRLINESSPYLQQHATNPIDWFPWSAEAFEKAGLTAETYLTGQCGALFTKMFVNDKIHQKGMFPPEVFETAQRRYYLNEASKLDITVDQTVEFVVHR